MTRFVARESLPIITIAATCALVAGFALVTTAGDADASTATSEATCSVVISGHVIFEGAPLGASSPEVAVLDHAETLTEVTQQVESQNAARADASEPASEMTEAPAEPLVDERLVVATAVELVSETPVEAIFASEDSAGKELGSLTVEKSVEDGSWRVAEEVIVMPEGTDCSDDLIGTDS